MSRRLCLIRVTPSAKHEKTRLSRDFSVLSWSDLGDHFSDRSDRFAIGFDRFTIDNDRWSDRSDRFAIDKRRSLPRSRLGRQFGGTPTYGRKRYAHGGGDRALGRMCRFAKSGDAGWRAGALAQSSPALGLCNLSHVLNYIIRFLQMLIYLIILLIQSSPTLGLYGGRGARSCAPASARTGLWKEVNALPGGYNTWLLIYLLLCSNGAASIMVGSLNALPRGYFPDNFKLFLLCSNGAALIW